MLSKDPLGDKATALAEIDQINLNVKPLSKFITSVGNFSIQYNFQSISIALLVMAAGVCTSSEEDCKDGTQASWVTTSASATVFIGAITGQLTMGYAGDMMGRNAAMTMTLSLVVLGALLSALASQGSPTAIYVIIIISRFVLGIGAGGVYPLSATKAAEDSGHGGGTVDVRAAAMAFFWQQPGAMAPWLLALLLAAIPGLSNTAIWRLLLGLGALPAAMVVAMSVYEMKLKSRARELQEQFDPHQAAIVNEAQGHNKDNAVIREALSKWSTWKDLIATGGGWFLYDIAYYGVNLFGGEILSKIDPSDDDNISSHGSIVHLAGEQLIGLSMGIPASFFFFLLAILFVPLRDNNTDALFALYILLLFSLSFGPNLTTYILPAQTYPKKVRATLNGISAACGKLGAFAGVYLFGSIAEASSYPTVMAICAGISLVGAWVSYQFITNADATRVIDRKSSTSSGPAGEGQAIDQEAHFLSSTITPLMDDHSVHDSSHSSVYSPGKL
eukprot:gene4307-4728_t